MGTQPWTDRYDETVMLEKWGKVVKAAGIKPE